MTAATTTISKTSAKKGASKVRAATPAQTIKYVAQDFARPTAGGALFAHTQAFLDLSGMAVGEACPRAFATKVIGVRAVAYHLSNGNFNATDKGLVITSKGELFFMERAGKTSPEMYKAYSEFFQKGAINEAINIKQAGSIAKL